MGLLFIPQIIYEYEECRWNDIDRGKLEEKPVSVSLRLPHGLTQVRTWVSMVRGQQ
jgi:hypothetical protein